MVEVTLILIVTLSDQPVTFGQAPRLSCDLQSLLAHVTINFTRSTYKLTAGALSVTCGHVLALGLACNPLHAFLAVFFRSDIEHSLLLREYWFLLSYAPIDP